jgi:hypothetical protein
MPSSSDFSDVLLVGQRLQPADLDEHAETNQAVFGEDVAKAVDLIGVASVGRGQGLQCRDFHQNETSVDLRAQSANHTRLPIHPRLENMAYTGKSSQ